MIGARAWLHMTFKEGVRGVTYTARKSAKREAQTRVSSGLRLFRKSSFST